MVAGLAGPERCIKRSAPNVKKNARFLLSPEKTVLYIARTVFQSVRIAEDKEDVCLI